MPNDSENPKTPKPEDSSTSGPPTDEQLNRIAEEAAVKARETERRYDQQHGTFPRGGPSGMA